MEIQINDDLARQVEFLARQMKSLPDAMQAQVFGDGCLAAAKVSVQKARAATAFTDKTGRLRKSIRARRQKDYFQGRPFQFAAAQMVVGGQGARQAWLIENGRTSPKPSAPRPFIWPAVISGQQEQIRAMVIGMQKSFIRTIKKLASGNPGARLIRLSGL